MATISELWVSMSSTRSSDNDTELVKHLLDGGWPVNEMDVLSALMLASQHEQTEVMKILLDTAVKQRIAKAQGDKKESLDKKDKHGTTLLMEASKCGSTEVAKLLLEKGVSLHPAAYVPPPASIIQQDERGRTALMMASFRGHTDLVRLLLEKEAPVEVKDEDGKTALMWASKKGHTKVVKQLLDKNALVNGTDDGDWTALMMASKAGISDVVKLLLDKGASLDVKDKDGMTALIRATEVAPKPAKEGHTEVAKQLLDKGALLDARQAQGYTALLALAGVDQDQLSRMAAAQVHRCLLERQGSDVPESAAVAVHQLVRLAGFARARALKLRSSDPRLADDHQDLFARLQLAIAACVRNDEYGKARDEKGVQTLLDSDYGRAALDHAVHIEAKDLLAQPVVQKYMKVAWQGEWDGADCGSNFEQDWRYHHGLQDWPYFAWRVLLLLQLLFVLPLVALVPLLDDRWRNEEWYLLRLPIVKFGLECTADLALALALTLIPAADLATAPTALLLLVWVGSGFLREAHQLMASTSSDAKSSQFTRVYGRLAAYWGDHINRLDAMGLTFSLAALVASLATDDREDATATSLRAAAVLLLWLRLFRVLLISPRFGPFVRMFFLMLFGDLLNFLVLLLFLLAAFTASWTVLLGSPSSLGNVNNATNKTSWTVPLENVDCADELGGDDIISTFLVLLEGALAGFNHFDCARNLAKTSVAAWMISSVYVTLTTVLLLNMLIAMCAAATYRLHTGHSVTPCLGPTGIALCPLCDHRMAKTFDNISEARTTNFLFLCAQRTLALQNEPPTPPPLNALGLPCHAIRAMLAMANKVETGTVSPPSVSATRPKASPPSPPPSPPVAKAAAVDFAAKIKATAGDQARSRCVTKAAEAAEAAEAESVKIAPLARKIMEYIIDHQDDVAQEDRWRTTMKRDMAKQFSLQQKAIEKQREAIDKQREAIDKQREAIDNWFDRAREEEVQKETQSLHAKMTEQPSPELLSPNARHRTPYSGRMPSDTWSDL